MIKTDIAVLGAGPAGSIAARQLGLAGLDVVLVDPLEPRATHTFESFPPSAAPLAEDIGILSGICSVSDGPASVINMAWRQDDERRVFDGDGPLLIQRRALQETLRSSAVSVCAFHQARARQVTPQGQGWMVDTSDEQVEARLVIDARGRRGKSRNDGELAAVPFAGWTDPQPGREMYLEAFRECWIWACRLTSGQVSGAILQAPSALGGVRAADRQTALLDILQHAMLPSLRDLSMGQPAAAGLAAAEDPVPTRNLILIGDAALSRDPIGSQGLVHAMRSAVQAGVAAQTMLDPASDPEAASQFLRIKHREACTAAKIATAQAYADQSRHDTAFWVDRSEVDNSAPPQQLTEGPVELAAPLTRAPILQDNRIAWAPAIETPTGGSYSTGVGAVTAVEIAAACRPAAPLQEIANRLGASHPMPAVFEALEQLVQQGAFVQARRSV